MHLKLSAAKMVAILSRGRWDNLLLEQRVPAMGKKEVDKLLSRRPKTFNTKVMLNIPSSNKHFENYLIHLKKTHPQVSDWLNCLRGVAGI